MRRTLLTITAIGLFVAALAGWAWFLSEQGLEDADRWASVVGLFVNTLLSVASLVVGVLAWRSSRSGGDGPLVVQAGGVYAGQDIHGQVRTRPTSDTGGAGTDLPVAGRWIGPGAVAAGRDIGAQARIDTTGTPATPDPDPGPGQGVDGAEGSR